MVRGKVEMKRIENATSRQVTFTKRRNGLMKKAFELSVMCDVEVGLIIFSQTGKLYEFATSSMAETIEHYQQYSWMIQSNDSAILHDNPQLLKAEVAKMMSKIEQLEASERKLLGEGIDTCSIEELQRLERLLDRSLHRIRTTQMELYKQRTEELEKELEAVSKRSPRPSHPSPNNSTAWCVLLS